MAGPSGITARGILEALYRRGGRVRIMIAEGWVLLTLHSLAEEGVVRRFAVKGKIFFSAVPGR